ncbi:MAG TPA: hypothetical protein PLK58_03040 [Candidatus Rifleibacterium sp.]|nr:hypothetical protein [Candidatus Rifleibacterium sp.]
MTSRHSLLALAVLAVLSLFLSGCNAFEAFDGELDARNSQALIDEGNLKLAAADYTHALDLFERAMVNGDSGDEAYRGRASAKAGLAGFNMFTVLDRLQNGTSPTDSSAIIFSAAKLIKDLKLLDEAIDDMSRLADPRSDDLLFRSLMSTLSAAKTLLAKYDTNLNQKLDTPDQIDFDTNDGKSLTWSQLYARLTSAGSAWSLEKAFLELAEAFNGRGTDWVLISPVNGASRSGTYTPANRSTILAVGALTSSLKTANAWFDKSESEFKTMLLNLDGAS